MRKAIWALAAAAMMFAGQVSAQQRRCVDYLSGTVFDQRARPLQGARVSATDLRTGNVYNSTTSQNGAYSMNMAPGLIYLVVSKSGFISSESTFIWGDSTGNSCGRRMTFNAILTPIFVASQPADPIARR